ncbi:MAG: hypothetical protein M3O70_13145, partial [Actinomycetota bacterium]|nr:hypothetical protein [Actinomycetota bacterium]
EGQRATLSHQMSHEPTFVVWLAYAHSGPYAPVVRTATAAGLVAGSDQLVGPAHRIRAEGEPAPSLR